MSCNIHTLQAKSSTRHSHQALFVSPLSHAAHLHELSPLEHALSYINPEPHENTTPQISNQQSSESDMSPINHLINIQAVAESAIEHIAPLLAIKDFQADEADIQNKATAIALEYDGVVTEMKLIMKACDALLNDPPAYGDEKQAEHSMSVRARQLQVHCKCALAYCEDGTNLVDDLDDMAMEVEDSDGSMSIAEAEMRAQRMESELNWMVDQAERLVKSYSGNTK